MKLVLVDLDEVKLAAAAQSIRATYPQIAIRTVAGDVTESEMPDLLHAKCLDLGEFGLLVNNAAILKGAGPWDGMQKWRRLMEINFWAALALQERFVPSMISTPTPSAIVNIGSKEGITTPPGDAAYSVSKAAIRVLTEQLAHELRESAGGHVTAHLLIPGYTFTPMNFPGMDAKTLKPAAPWSADQVVDRLIQGMGEGSFYIFCEDNEVTRELDQRRMQWSADDLILGRPALSRWHRDYKDEFTRFVSGAGITKIRDV